jgi:OmpA-OmpF porin, OOP family
MNSINKLSLAALAVMSMLPAVTLAQNYPNQGYLVDGSGKIVMSGYGLCWHTGEWTPALAVEPCDPVIKRIVSVPPMPEPKAVVIAAAPVAPPPPMPAPVKPLPKKISFSADALFAFDKAILKPEGKVMLDDLVRQLNDATTYDKIILTGHTDRFGSNAYNQKLSERRANAVKGYLVSKGIAESRIEASGLGETHPETKPGDCPGAQNAKVIACLQPDRRVDVEMTGTKTVGN